MSLAAIPPPPFEAFHIWHLRITVHGLLIIIPILLAVALTVPRWRARGGQSELVYEVALWGVLGGIVGARLYFVATSWSEVPGEWWGPFAVWRGGLASWGGLLGGTLAGAWVVHRRRASIPLFMDAIAPGLLLAYGIGRLGNYFNQELFGPPSDLPWALEVDPASRPAGYESYATFHPTFLYELVWDLVLVLALLWIDRRLRLRPPSLFILFVAGYSFGRIFGELFFRIDPAHEFLGLRLNFYVATALFLVSAVLFVWWQRREPATPGDGTGVSPRAPSLPPVPLGTSDPRTEGESSR